MSSQNEKTDEKALTPRTLRELEVLDRLYEEALAEGGEVEIKEGETWLSAPGEAAEDDSSAPEIPS